MIISFVVAVFFKLIIPFPQEGTEAAWYQMEHWQLLTGIGITTTVWLIITFLTKPENEDTLKKFVRLTQPGGPGWKRIHHLLEKENFPPVKHQLPLEVFCMFVGVITVYGVLFATGFWIYSQIILAIIFTIITCIGSIILYKVFGKLRVN